jgi:hypothetical protein
MPTHRVFSAADDVSVTVSLVPWTSDKLGATVYPELAMSSFVDSWFAAVEQYKSYCTAAVKDATVMDRETRAVAAVAEMEAKGEAPDAPVPAVTSVPVGAVAPFARATHRTVSCLADVRITSNDIPGPKLDCVG